MTSEDLKTLDTYIRQNRSFAIYRLPGEGPEAVRFVMQATGPLQQIHSLDELNGQKGFVMAPFRITSQQPVILIRPDITDLNYREAEEVIPIKKETIESSFPESFTAYKKRFETFLQPLKAKSLQKVVLSRRKVVERPEQFSPANAFLKACRQYTRSYVYLCHTPLSGTWLGSTPEMLLSGKGKEWNTVALAGTAQLINGELPAEWNTKNREEQEVVTCYIASQLASIGIETKKNGPYTVRAAHLAHLKTDFRFSLPDSSQSGTLLKLLHPTPAIAGIPKEQAITFITEQEGYMREWYSGFLGELNPSQSSNLYVNLRCMHIKDKTLSLFAGSGLLPTSSAEEEWQETEDKLQTMELLIDN